MSDLDHFHVRAIQRLRSDLIAELAKNDVLTAHVETLRELWETLKPEPKMSGFYQPRPVSLRPELVAKVLAALAASPAAREEDTDAH